MSHDTPLVYNGAVYRDGETMILTINRQETIQLAHDQDLTGTRIASTQVISVYSGNECANVPKENGYCDHLVEMLTPTSTWGRRFVTAPLFSRKAGDFFRVVASQDNTVVTFHPNDWNLLSAGQYMERDIPSDEYKFITATKPCLLMQYSKGADSDNTNTDPFLIMIPPIEQYGSHYILSTPDRPEQQYFQSYINVIVLSDHYQGVLVDGNPAYRYSVFKKIPGTPYSASAVRVTKGVHRVDHTSPIVTFGAFMYGFAWRDSYGYPGGLRLADITGECTGRIDTPADGMDNDCDRRIDEELKNGIDDDGDGLIDEDLATFPPTIEIDTPYYEYESCVFEVSFKMCKI
jgi:CUB/sushi domain-containing protein